MSRVLLRSLRQSRRVLSRSSRDVRGVREISSASAASAPETLAPRSLEPFLLERFFSKHEFTAPYLLCSSDCEPLSLREALDRTDAQGRAMWEGLSLSYTETRGDPRMLEAISELYDGVDSSRLLTAAPQELIYLFMQALLNPGERVVVTAPGYQSLAEVARSSGCEVSLWEPEAGPGATRFCVDRLEDILGPVSNAPKLLVVNFPHNPTGALPSTEEYKRIAELCEARGTVLFSDEMYRGLQRDTVRALPSAADIYERAVALGGMSKVYGMPGIRLGWLAFGGCDFLDAPMARVSELRDYTTICSPGPSEALCYAGLRVGSDLAARCNAICDAGIRAAESLGSDHGDILEWETPPGGSTAFPRVALPGWTATEFCETAIDGCGVLLLPGDLYHERGQGGSYGRGRVRLGFGRENCAEACKVLGEWITDAKADGTLNAR